jgi:anti-sigma B factor antagonist
MAALELAERRLGAVTVVELSGHLVADDGDSLFTNRITELVAVGQANVLVDLSRVTYIDSGGVGALVAKFLHAARRGGRLKILRPSERVRRVLAMTRLIEIFEVFEDEDAAVRSFAKLSVLPELARRLSA